jgi:hypothetical protein
VVTARSIEGRAAKMKPEHTNMELEITSALSTTSNAKVMTAILEYLGQRYCSKDLIRRLEVLHPTPENHQCVYDVWTQRIDGKRAAFGLLAYTCDAPGNVPVIGHEMCMSTSVGKVKKACQQIKETIWMPTDLLMSREQYEELDRLQGITRQ